MVSTPVACDTKNPFAQTDPSSSSTESQQTLKENAVNVKTGDNYDALCSAQIPCKGSTTCKIKPQPLQIRSDRSNSRWQCKFEVEINQSSDKQKPCQWQCLKFSTQMNHTNERNSLRMGPNYTTTMNMGCFKARADARETTQREDHNTKSMKQKASSRHQKRMKHEKTQINNFENYTQTHTIIASKAINSQKAKTIQFQKTHQNNLATRNRQSLFDLLAMKLKPANSI